MADVTTLIVDAKAIAAFLANEASPPIHNFSGDAMAVWRLTAKATGLTLKSDDIVAGAAIGIKYFYMHYVEMVAREGDKINSVVRTALIDADGTAYSFVSTGVAQGIMQLVQSLGSGPYDPAVRVQLQEIRTRHGHRTLLLVPAD